jgi:transposase
LALVLEERPRIEAARTCGRQTLRDWVHRYNAEGLRGLSDRKPPGGIPKLKAEQEEEVAAWVRAGPDLAEDGRWRRKDLATRIERRFGVVLAERSVGASVWLSGTSAPASATGVTGAKARALAG